MPEPEPVPTPEPPKPQDEAPPRPADDLANPMQIDGDAQAGNDAFNIGAGQGKGMSGGGGGRAGNATYSQYLAYALQKILREDERTRNLTFRLQANIWLTASGQVTRVELTKSSGDADVDARVVAALRAVPALDERPPASVSMPIRASLTGRRPPEITNRTDPWSVKTMKFQLNRLAAALAWPPRAPWRCRRRPRRPRPRTRPST